MNTPPAPLASTAAAASAEAALRVAVVTETYPPEVNGVAMTMGRLVAGLTARGHRVQVIRPRQGRADRGRYDDRLQELPQPGVPIPFYRELRLGLPVSRTLERLWRESRPDLVHIVTEGPLGAAALRVAGRRSLPVVSGFHTNFHSYSRHYGLGLLQRPALAYLRRFHNRTRCTLVPTRELAEGLAVRGFVNTRVLSRGVDVRLFGPERRREELRLAWGVGPDTPVVLYVGRLAAEKNLNLAVRTFQALEVEARFVLVGEGPLGEELRRRHPDFVFAGQRVGEDLAAHYASADLFLFPSLTETFGNVTLEAMASALAVVAFDYAAARRHIEAGVSGVRVPVGDDEAFIAAARDLARNPIAARAMGQRAHRVVQPLDWTRIVEELEDTYRQCLLDGGSDDEPATVSD